VALPIVLLPPSEGKAAGGRGAWDPASGAFGGLAAQRAVVARALDRSLLDGAPVLPAWQRYTGVVWQHLDPGSLSPAARRRIVVVSGLLGLVRGDDPVPDHRLKLSVTLGRLGRLDRWWRPVLTDALRAHAGRRPVWDLLPNEHAAAVVLEGVRCTRVRCVTADGAGAAGHAAKAVKGIAARTILERGDLGALAWQGWRAERIDDDTVRVRAPA